MQESETNFCTQLINFLTIFFLNVSVAFQEKVLKNIIQNYEQFDYSAINRQNKQIMKVLQVLPITFTSKRKYFDIILVKQAKLVTKNKQRFKNSYFAT